MTNRSAAGLRHSAIAARIRLREEWSELKGLEEPTKPLNRIPEIIRKNQKPVRSASKLIAQKVKFTTNKKRSPNAVLKKRNQNIVTNVPISERNMNIDVEALRGVVALVDVGTETRALTLRAALMALGASVVPFWSPIVTHLVWTQGGCRDTRAKARALGCRLVSPLWVEACASCGRRVAEAAFPAAARPSDLPSPRALRIMLKRAEAENIPLSDLLNKKDSQQNKPVSKEQRLRISSETEHDTTNSSHDTSTDRDTSHDRSKDSTDPTIRVNTLPRGGHVGVKSPTRPKSRRKLFTQKEAEVLADKDDDETPAVPKRTPSKLTLRERRDLARAERMARRMLGADTPAKTHAQILSQAEAPRIVLTGMSRNERQAVHNAVKSLNGHVQKQVNHRTTHVVLGSCISSSNDHTGIRTLDDTHCSKITSTKKIPSTNTRSMTSMNTRCGIPSTNRSMTSMNTRCGIPSTNTRPMTSMNTRCGIPSTNTRPITSMNTRCGIPSTNTRCEIPSTNTMSEIPSITQRCGIEKARTLNALLGAARGCRVVYAQWVADSAEVKKWLHHYGYEVTHLRKISQKARVERTALGRTCSDYAFDVFRGMRVRVSAHADQRDAASQLLALCGGVVQNGGPLDEQNGRHGSADFDVCVGNGEGEVSSKWVFDSVAAGRMRTTRRYVNLPVENR